jgi:hypothetical protein
MSQRGPTPERHIHPLKRLDWQLAHDEICLPRCRCIEQEKKANSSPCSSVSVGATNLRCGEPCRKGSSKAMQLPGIITPSTTKRPPGVSAPHGQNHARHGRTSHKAMEITRDMSRSLGLSTLKTSTGSGIQLHSSILVYHASLGGGSCGRTASAACGSSRCP